MHYKSECYYLRICSFSSQIDKIMNSIDVGINSELQEMNGETSKEPLLYIVIKECVPKLARIDIFLNNFIILFVQVRKVRVENSVEIRLRPLRKSKYIIKRVLEIVQRVSHLTFMQADSR